jgi:hypothetical protein
MASDREKALASGSNDFDTKPIEFDRLRPRSNRPLPPRKASQIRDAN